MRRAYAADISVIDDAVGRWSGPRAQGDPRRHLDHLHERPRRDGGEPRPHVQVRAVRAGGAGPAHHPTSDGCEGGGRGRLVEHLDVPATVREIAGAPDVGRARGVRSSTSWRRRSRVTRDVSVSENWGFAVFETDGTSSSSTRTPCMPCQLFDLAEDPSKTRTSSPTPRPRSSSRS